MCDYTHIYNINLPPPPCQWYIKGMYSCQNPIIAVSLFESLGKKKLKFIPKTVDWNIQSLNDRYGKENVFTLPCGQCEACRRNYAKDWSIRCFCEAQEHEYNYFLTLTYSPEYINQAIKKDLDDFLDRLEGHDHKFKFKYFACSEYGELNGRYHFHLAIFGDRSFELYDETFKNGFFYYHSKIIDKYWKFGLHSISPFGTNCARYIAKYTSKEGAKIYMSRNIGKTYFNNHFKEIIANGFKLYGDFGKDTYSAPIPQAFGRWFLELENKDFNLYKLNRVQLGRLFSLAGLHQMSCKTEDEYLRNRQSRTRDILVKRRRTI